MKPIPLFLFDNLPGSAPASVNGIGVTELMFVLIIAIFVLAIVASYFSMQARRKAWGELADRTGLTLEGNNFFGKLRLVGAYRNHPMQLYTYTVHSGKSSHTYTRIHMETNNPAGLSLALYRENLLNKIGKAVGMQDIQLGDDELDRRYIIRGQPSNEVAFLFTSINLRQKLLDTPIHSLRLDEHTLEHSQSGVVNNVDTLQAQFDTMADLADAIERASSGSSPTF